jgi:hypothetical protein
LNFRILGFRDLEGFALEIFATSVALAVAEFAISLTGRPKYRAL